MVIKKNCKVAILSSQLLSCINKSLQSRVKGREKPEICLRLTRNKLTAFSIKSWIDLHHEKALKLAEKEENISLHQIECNIWHSIPLNTAKFTLRYSQAIALEIEACWSFLIVAFLLACSIKLNEIEIWSCRKYLASDMSSDVSNKDEDDDVKHHNNLTNDGQQRKAYSSWRDLFIHRQRVSSDKNQLRRRKERRMERKYVIRFCFLFGCWPT